MARKEINITLYMSEIIYDIQVKTFITGRSRASAMSPEDVAHMQANDDDENINQLLRSISSAVAAMKGRLAEYIDGTGAQADNILLEAGKNIVLTLSMPSNFNEEMRQPIAAALHRYIVCTAIAEWLLMTDKPDAADYATLAEQAIAEVRTAAHRRIRPVRRTETNNQ